MNYWGRSEDGVAPSNNESSNNEYRSKSAT